MRVDTAWKMETMSPSRATTTSRSPSSSGVRGSEICGQGGLARSNSFAWETQTGVEEKGENCRLHAGGAPGKFDVERPDGTASPHGKRALPLLSPPSEVYFRFTSSETRESEAVSQPKITPTFSSTGRMDPFVRKAPFGVRHIDKLAKFTAQLFSTTHSVSKMILFCKYPLSLPTTWETWSYAFAPLVAYPSART